MPNCPLSTGSSNLILLYPVADDWQLPSIPEERLVKAVEFKKEYDNTKRRKNPGEGEHEECGAIFCVAVDKGIVPFEEQNSQTDEPHVTKCGEEVTLVVETGILCFFGEWIHRYC